MDTSNDSKNLKVEIQANINKDKNMQNDSRSPKVERSSKGTGERRTADDFYFGKLIGEGSFSNVFLAKDIHTNQEYAVKVCEQAHIKREKKVEQIVREREVMDIINTKRIPTAPFFVKLSYAFTDSTKLYFVMTYCPKGELLELIQRVGNFDRECVRFYTAEIARALEHLHSLNIIHRDLKPENILLDQNMHIKISDFGSSKILSKVDTEKIEDGRPRKSSFVGTAQYVSPELLESKNVGPWSDLWALGCIIYQMVSGLPPFRSRFIFANILRLNHEFRYSFKSDFQSQVIKVIECEARLGARDIDGYPSIRNHPLFEGLNFDSLHEQTPPEICMPEVEAEPNLWENHREPGLGNELELLLGSELKPGQSIQCQGQSIKIGDGENKTETTVVKSAKRNIADVGKEEEATRLATQEKDNQWHRFVEGNLILKQGLIDKRKGLFPRRRMFLLTTGPHLYYIDPVNMVLKGEIPWDPTIKPEAKNFKTFFVHTPSMVDRFEDINGFILHIFEW
ncbi:unnamed protein product, partial [Meganyctiphanes norvegica]